MTSSSRHYSALSADLDALNSSLGQAVDEAGGPLLSAAEVEASEKRREEHQSRFGALVDTEPSSYASSPLRWAVLLIFCVGTVANAVVWITFAPIQNVAAHYFQVDSVWIDSLSISFMALYLPGYFLAYWLMESRGLRAGIVLAGGLQAVGAGIRCLALVDSDDNRAKGFAFPLLMVGQSLAALAQPMFTNAPARLSADWFPASQRNLATTIGAMCNPIGIAVGQLLPPALVSDAGEGMSHLLFTCAGIAGASWVLSMLFLRSAPATPPSRSAWERNQLKWAEREEFSRSGAQAKSFWQSPLVRELRSLLSNAQFLILCFGVGVGLGLFNAVTTLIEKIVLPAGYGKDDAGNFGAVLIGCGLLGAAIVGPVMDKTHAYNGILKGGLLAALAGTAFMLLNLRPDHYAVVFVSFGVLGLVMLPLLPVCMECAAECTYPVSEDASTGAMLFCGNFVGILMIVSVDTLIEDHYRTVFNPAALTLLGLLLLAVMIVGLFYSGPLNRQAAEKSAREESERVHMHALGLTPSLSDADASLVPAGSALSTDTDSSLRINGNDALLDAENAGESHEALEHSASQRLPDL